MKSTVIRSEIVIVGSGPGGATAAKELASGRKEVLILEKGSSAHQTVLYKNRAGIPFKMLSALKKSLGIHPSAKNISIRSWRGVGGTSTVSSGNVVRGWEERLGALGIDLEEEWQELEQELGISPFPERLIGEGARSLAEAAESLGIKMERIPKSIDFDRCIGCGNCQTGCPHMAKWSADRFVDNAVGQGARLISRLTASRVLTRNGKAVGLLALDEEGQEITVESDTVILAAGAVETPLILSNSGLETAGKGLFCHPFLTVSGPVKNRTYQREPRSVFSRQFLEKEGFTLYDCIVSPSEDNSSHPGSLGIMIKVKDDATGEVLPDGTIRKRFTAGDLRKARTSIGIAREILFRAGVKPRDIRVQFHTGLHPGGTAAIGEAVDMNQETGIKNCFVADASLLPGSQSLPPILTIMALSKRLARALSGKRTGKEGSPSSEPANSRPERTGT